MKINIIKKNSINIIVTSKLLCLFINKLITCNFICLFYIKKKIWIQNLLWGKTQKLYVWVKCFYKSVFKLKIY